MVRSNLHFSIDEGFQQLARTEVGRFQTRPEFHDPLLMSFQKCSLSQLIDQQFEAVYNPSGPVELLTRVFRRFRRS